MPQGVEHKIRGSEVESQHKVRIPEEAGGPPLRVTTLRVTTLRVTTLTGLLRLSRPSRCDGFAQERDVLTVDRAILLLRIRRKSLSEVIGQAHRAGDHGLGVLRAWHGVPFFGWRFSLGHSLCIIPPRIHQKPIKLLENTAYRP